MDYSKTCQLAFGGHYSANLIFPPLLTLSHTLTPPAHSQPGDQHPHHRAARGGDGCAGEPVLGPLPPQREPADRVRRRHPPPLGDHRLPAGLRHHGLGRQVWKHQHRK